MRLGKFDDPNTRFQTVRYSFQARCSSRATVNLCTGHLQLAKSANVVDKVKIQWRSSSGLAVSFDLKLTSDVINCVEVLYSVVSDSFVICILKFEL